jgi:hypothetical protein
MQRNKLIGLIEFFYEIEGCLKVHAKLGLVL